MREPLQHLSLQKLLLLPLTLTLSLTATTVNAQDVDATSNNNSSSLLWGPYRPNLYFGVRPRIPKSLTTGLMWGRVDDFRFVQTNIRHTCEQHEGMAGYGWDAYDTRTGGSQTIHDAGNGIDLTTEFVKFPESGSNGGGWGVRVRGVPREDAENAEELRTSLWFYAGLEGLGSVEVVGAEEDDGVGATGDVTLSGQTNDLGEFTLKVLGGEGEIKNVHPGSGDHPAYDSKPLDRTFIHSVQVPDEAIWQAKCESILDNTAICFPTITTKIRATDCLTKIPSRSLFQSEDHD